MDRDGLITLDSPPTAPAIPPSTYNHRSTWNRNQLFGLILGGQLLSLLITGTGVFSQLLAERGINIPTSQSFLNYVLLSLCLIPHYYSYRQKKHNYYQLTQRPLLLSTTTSSSSLFLPPSPPFQSSPSSPTPPPPTFLSIPFYWYLLLAFCDVEGNFLLVTAYQFTSITSIQLLDCFTIPLIMALSYCLFRQSYTRQHFLGACTCLIGMALLIFSDQLQLPSSSSPSSSSSHQLIGDMLVLLGCCCYAVTNIGQERIVKHHDRIEFLAMIGCFGSIISFFQILIVERTALMNIRWHADTIGYMIGFAACLYLLYLSVPVLLKRSSALFFNLSILTSDFWAVVFGCLLFGSNLHLLYFVAFTLIVIGLIVYNLAVAGTSIKDALKGIWERREDDAEEVVSRRNNWA